MTPCINWAGAKNNKGYGHRYVKGVYYLAHRYAWEQANGPIPYGKIIRHKCDNRLCINPDHLEPESHLDNSADAKSRGRPIGKVSFTPIEERLKDWLSGMSYEEVANKHHTSRGAINKQIRRIMEPR